jgi:outer membrane protein assembly factor BamB
LNADSGALIWDYITGDDVFSSPAISDGNVYIGSYDNNVYCLDASNGSAIWTYETDGYIYSSPAVIDGKVYIGSMERSTLARLMIKCIV